MAVDWNRPLRHRISGKRVWVVLASSSKNQVALGYTPHGPTEEMVMRNGMQSASSEFLDLENCSEHDFGPKRQALSSQSKAAERIKAKREQGLKHREALRVAQQEDALAMADNPIWGSF